ncbi:MAG: ParB N-terminal domain-containing protein [Oscillospiraceae bacterium]|nr:ParB N-terminal domain-containing protein [Oscillospiraceae bacterium]
MSNYVELPVDLIKLDVNNPRIARGLSYYSDINSDLMALLLGSTAESCASLRESIRENGGIIHPIVVNREEDGSYVVIEGNTRLQIYRDFIKNGESGNWTTIKAIVYDNLPENDKHAIRLQAHLVGPREWDPYSKALYLHHLAFDEHMPMNMLVSFCGGTSKASEIKNMIAAYNDMEQYYRPLCNDDSQFDIKKFHGFVELQNRNITDCLVANGFTKTDFSQWMIDERFSTLQDVRRLPEIFRSKKAKETFFVENTREAKKYWQSRN